LRTTSKVLSKVLCGLALSLAAYGFAADAKPAEKSAVGEAAISGNADADADANCDRSKCPKGSACAKAHASHAKGSHVKDAPAQAEGAKGADDPQGQCGKHKEAEAEVIPEKSEKSQGKPAVKPTDAVKTETHSG
jgi:hypothetical protein